MEENKDDKSNLDFKLLAGLAALVALLSVPTLHSIVSVEGLEVPTPVAPIESIAPQSLNDVVAREKVLAHEMTLELDCSAIAQKNFATHLDRVQLTGRNCSDKAGGIRNVTTGYSASMFFPKSEVFLTDYIQLREGENKIMVAGMSGEQFELVINRRSQPEPK